MGRRTFELANEEWFEFEAYLAAVSWHEQLTDALVLRSDSDPLLGMALLRGGRGTLYAVTLRRSQHRGSGTRGVNGDAGHAANSEGTSC